MDGIRNTGPCTRRDHLGVNCGRYTDTHDIRLRLTEHRLAILKHIGDVNPVCLCKGLRVFTDDVGTRGDTTVREPLIRRGVPVGHGESVGVRVLGIWSGPNECYLVYHYCDLYTDITSI